ncbi:branched-chain amino acid ABC transporter substrate-binding protein, partial [Candidatus Magnetomorum sp. HK-1]
MIIVWTNYYMMKKAIQYSIFFFVLLFVAACYQDIPPEERAKRAFQNKGDILIGIVESVPEETMFAHGIQLAVSEINLKGGVMGRLIRTVIDYDYNSEHRSLSIAHKFSRNADMTAVIGHFNYDFAMSASIIYKQT